MELKINVSEYGLIYVALETRLTRIDQMIYIFEKDEPSLVPVYEKERQDVQELINKISQTL